ncbi:MAG: CHAT domain-containing protein [Saprospiraceae bacterium]|nr:CHAT domain-containing protein [Saprospiraceae bacterium]
MKCIFFITAFCFFLELSYAQDYKKYLSHSFEEFDSLMFLSYSEGRYNDAIIYMQAAKEKSKGQYGRLDTLYALYTGNLGFFYVKTGQYELGEALYIESKDIIAEISGKEHASYASSLNNLAMLYRTMGKYSKAEPLLREANKLNAKIYDKKHPLYASSLNNLAILYQDMGKYAEAEPLLLDAKRINAISGKLNSNYALSLNNLALLYQLMNRYTQAEMLYIEAREIYAQVVGKTHPDYASSINNLAVLYQDMGADKKAEPLLLEAKFINSEVFGEMHPNYATILNNIAMLYQNMNSFEKAEPLLLEVNEMNLKLVGKEHPDYALGINNLAILYRDMGAYIKSELLLKEAKNIYSRLFGKEHSGYVMTINNLASLYLEMDLLDSAFLFCMNSLKANISVGDVAGFSIDSLEKYTFYSNHQVIKSVNNLLKIVKKQYHKDSSQLKLNEHYAIARAAIHFNEHIRNDFSTEGDKLRVLETSHDLICQGLETVVLQNQLIYLGEAFSFAEFNKSVLLADAMKGNRAKAFGELPESLLNIETKFQKEMTSLRKKAYDANTQEEKRSIRQSIGELNIEISKLLKTIKDKYPKYHAFKYENFSISAEEIQELLDPKTALIEYLLSDSICYMFVVSKQEIQLFPIPLNLDELKKKVKTLRFALSNYHMIIAEQEKAYEMYTKTAFWFYENLLKKALSGRKYENLIIITDGELGHLPFESFLVEAVSGPIRDYSDLPYLVLDYNISYNYSATLWKNNLNIEANDNNGEVLAFASDYYKPDSNLLDIRLPYYVNLRKNLHPLPAANKEIEELAGRFQGKFLSGKSANERMFKQHAQDYGIIHLAMHGILESSRPLLSSLVFTENLDSTEDNFLQAYEISHMKLNADMVVLSACETGYGRFKQGEGIVSLARSFMYAGVPSLLVSLWQVNDVTTASIMEYFYDNLAKDIDKSAALRMAKLTYLENISGIAAHPAYWSPFIQLGNSNPIQLKTSKVSFYWIIMTSFIFIFLIGIANYFYKRLYNR